MSQYSGWIAWSFFSGMIGFVFFLMLKGYFLYKIIKKTQSTQKQKSLAMCQKLLMKWVR